MRDSQHLGFGPMFPGLVTENKVRVVLCVEVDDIGKCPVVAQRLSLRREADGRTGERHWDNTARGSHVGRTLKERWRVFLIDTSSALVETTIVL